MKNHQQLATLEERYCLALDLHDGVKQQIFALAMQIGTLKVLIKRDSDAALEHLENIEHLVHQTQQDLTLISRELSPKFLEN